MESGILRHSEDLQGLIHHVWDQVSQGLEGLAIIWRSFLATDCLS